MNKLSKIELKAELAAKAWNEKYPVGTAVVRYKLINPLREPVQTKTRSEAWVMGGHSAIVKVDGVAGGVLLESLQVQESVQESAAAAPIILAQ